MYEELYQPLPDQEAYLARINASAPADCTLNELNHLLYAHQRSIPFENLDVCDFHKTLSLAITDLYDKIVVRKRGGYCFELNALFHSFLLSCGFHSYPCMARIVNGKDFTPPILHRAILVTIEDQLYFCDVGYGGPMPACSVPVTDQAEVTACGQKFRMNQADEYWWTVSYFTDNNWRPILQFTTMPQEPVDYITLSYYSSTSPASVFTQKRMVNIRTPEGNKSITDMTYTTNTNGVHTEKEITDQTELSQILLQEFNLKVKY